MATFTDQKMGKIMTETIESIEGVRHCACGCGTVIARQNQSGYARGHKSKHRFAQLQSELKEAQSNPSDDSQAKNLLDNVSDLPTFPGDKLSKEVKQDIQDKCDFLLTLAG